MGAGQGNGTELASKTCLVSEPLSYLPREEHIGSRNEFSVEKVVAEGFRVLPTLIELMIDVIAAIGKLCSGCQHTNLELLFEISLQRGNERASSRL